MAVALTFGGGALLGFASSLHCVGMCGGIALLMAMPGQGPEYARTAKAGVGRGMQMLLGQLPAHGGRAVSYMILGGLAGGLGSVALGSLEVAGAHLLMRWAAAMTLGWVGLSTLGLVPSPAVVGHALLPRFAYAGAFRTAPAGVGRFAAGLGWGLMPCGMVYGALLYAAFAGSVAGGMLVMAGFALGTLPALLLVGSGSSVLARLARKPQLRWIAGIAILLLAILSTVPAEASLLALCRAMF